MKARYAQMKVDGKKRLAHRVIMERHLGRPLTRAEVVHHRNGDRFDNRIENLEVLSHKEHSGHHNRKYPDTSECVVCGASFTPAATKRGGRKQTCSRPCFRILLRQRQRDRLNDPAYVTRLRKQGFATHPFNRWADA